MYWRYEAIRNHFLQKTQKYPQKRVFATTNQLSAYVPKTTTVNGLPLDGNITIPIPTKTSELENDSEFVSQTELKMDKFIQIAGEHAFYQNIELFTNPQPGKYLLTINATLNIRTANSNTNVFNMRTNYKRSTSADASAGYSGTILPPLGSLTSFIFSSNMICAIASNVDSYQPLTLYNYMRHENDGSFTISAISASLIKILS